MTYGTGKLDIVSTKGFCENMKVDEIVQAKALSIETSEWDGRGFYLNGFAVIFELVFQWLILVLKKTKTRALKLGQQNFQKNQEWSDLIFVVFQSRKQQ